MVASSQYGSVGIRKMRIEGKHTVYKEEGHRPQDDGGAAVCLVFHAGENTSACCRVRQEASVLTRTQRSNKRMKCSVLAAVG